jgi:hypothetical protein
VVTALFDTTVLLDYLLGDKRAAPVSTQPSRLRSLRVEVMSVAPDKSNETTRAFLRSFEGFH